MSGTDRDGGTMTLEQAITRTLYDVRLARRVAELHPDTAANVPLYEAVLNELLDAVPRPAR